MLLAFHIDLDKSSMEELKAKLIDANSNDLTKYLVVFEKGKKTGKHHFQGIALSSSCQKEQDKHMKRYRKLLKDMLGDRYKKQAQQVSWTPVRMGESKYIKYLLKDCKSLDDIIFMKGYNPDDIQPLIAQPVDEDEVKKKSHSPPIGKTLLAYCEDHINLFLNNGILDESKLLLLVTSFFGEETKSYRKFVIEGYYNTMKYKFTKRTALEDMLYEFKAMGITFNRVNVKTGERDLIITRPDRIVNSFLDEGEA